MPIHMLRRISATALLTLTLLAASSLPAAAADLATHVRILPSGTIVIQPSTGGSPVATIHTKDHTTTSPCAPINSQAESRSPIAFNSSGGATITPFSTNWYLFTVAANNYKVRLNITAGTLAKTATPHGVTVTLTATLQFSTCDSSANLCVTNPFMITMQSQVSHTIDDHPFHLTIITVAGVTGAITTPLSCNAVLRSVLNGTHAAMSLSLNFIKP